MNREEIKQKLIDIMIKEYGITEEHIKKYPNLNDLGLDSLDYISLWLKTEDLFKIDIDEFEMRSCVTSEDLLDLIEKKLKG